MTLLARLSFAVPPAAAGEFARGYESSLLPLLRAHGLDGAGPCRRETPPGFFSRLFAVDALAQIGDVRQRLRRDPDWQRAVADCARRFPRPDDHAPYMFDLYQAPAGPPRVVEVGRGTRQGLWHNFGSEDGLPASMVTRLFRDSRGRLWLASLEGGICRYDGAHFHSYTSAEGLPDDSVLDIHENRRGDLWFTMGKGLCRYDGATFHHFTSADGLPANRSNSVIYRSAIYEDSRGQLWINREEAGVIRFDGRRFTHFTTADGLAGNAVRRVVEDRRGNIWIAAENGGATVFDGETFTAHTAADGLVADEIVDLLLDRRGRLWFAAESGGVSRCDDGAAPAFVNYDATAGMAGDNTARIYEDRQGRVWLGHKEAAPSYHDGSAFAAFPDGRVGNCLQYEDRDGHLWFTTFQNGLAYYDGKRTWTFTAKDGLAHDRTEDMYEDEEGFLWMATWGGGLSRFDGKHFAHFSDEDLGAQRVEVLRADRVGRVWIGTWGGGLSCHDGQDLIANKLLADDHIWSICIDAQDRVWIGTWGNGVFRIDGESLTNYTASDGLAHSSVWSICQDRRGHMWFGTQGGGVSRFDGREFTNYTTANGLTHDQVWSIVEDGAGDMWFSCLDSGLCRFDGEKFTTYTSQDGLAHDNIWYLLVDSRGQLWCGTWGGGVSCFDGEKFTNYTRGDGLANNNVRSICEDAEGHMWFGTYGGGVSRFDGQVFQTIAKKDGLIDNAVQHVEQAPDGAMWIATEAGVSRYKSPRKPPQIHLQGVVADRRYAPGEDIAVSATQQLVAFEFQGTSFTTAPDQFAYVYRLEGRDTGWQTAYQRRVEYRDLPPGDFTFQVRAVDRDLNYSEPVAVSLAIAPDTQQDRIDALAAELSQPQGLEQFIGQSPALQQTLDQIHTVADTDVTVLILGETGTGKGLAARAIHSLSQRKEEPFIQLNCGAIPEGLVESELFGHEKGAFTGAVQRKIGRFELADGGTLFLDEIGDLPLASQQVLLHVLQDGTFQRVGGDQTLAVDVRVVAATNRDLRSAMRAGTFREDLYYRLSAFALHLPPLRQRLQDVPLLLQHFVEQFARHLSRPLPSIDAAVLTLLQQHDWPGNVRELEHLAQHALLVCKNHRITPEDIPTGTDHLPQPAGMPTLDQQRARAESEEKALIERALQATNWIVSGDRGAAQLLNAHPEKLRMRMRKFGLKRPKKKD